MTNANQKFALPRPSLHHGLTFLLFTIPVIVAIATTAAFYRSGCRAEKEALQRDFDAERRKLRRAVDAANLTTPTLHVPPDEAALQLKKAAVDYDSIWMSNLEVNLVLRYLGNVQSYLEWGSGGSTFNFPLFVKRAVSIEHNEEWCTTVRRKLQANPKLHHVEFHCVPIPRGYMGWGKSNPFEEGNYEVFRKYIDEIDNIADKTYDMVLIDGRSRVDAAIKALSYIRDDSFVVLHDASRIWTSTRYAEVSKYYHLVDSIGGDDRQGIAVLKRKKEFKHLQGDREAVQKMLNEKYGLTA